MTGPSPVIQVSQIDAFPDLIIYVFYTPPGPHANHVHGGIHARMATYLLYVHALRLAPASFDLTASA